MPEWLLWGLVIVLAVAAGWAWGDWRRRAGGDARRRPDRAGGRGTTTRPRPRTRPAGGRGTRVPGRSGTPPRPRAGGTTAGDAPRPGEIWWADVPYADGTGSKVRPCLVLRVDGSAADVLKITSRDRSDRDDHVRIPTRDWDPGAEHDSFLDVAEAVEVDRADFQDRAGTCDPALWRRLRRLPHLPTG
ncbi:PemK-like, MazF-like toxin of type II toxin-antitoxin system [Micromonospora nigra]|uniref:PemK-like, MazF-like toxin of type II toxin-antitoxin system n=1 Tax=Micromonospora nigra TaxID=145857 RepID=A0A1C6SJH8_9ACTN|nr:type II toxin-antitoxin system PemK/MazF family toxin [Micromonospora nigra]SCL29535.1 PemK-like, MazF-like toxin of type II toxin-antitoxin system [Micromonospora nigra]